MMIDTSALSSIASFARFAAGALILVVAIRFAVISWSGPEREAAPIASSPAAAPPGSSQTASVPHTPRVAGKPIRVHVSVNAGPPRADVLVDGARLGLAPFIGDYSCHTGDPVLIEVVPAKGETLKFERTCEPGMLRVE
jgi:hypothetical protein